LREYNEKFILLKIEDLINLSEPADVIEDTLDTSDGYFNNEGVYIFNSEAEELEYMLKTGSCCTEEELEEAAMYIDVAEWYKTNHDDLLNGYDNILILEDQYIK
jgi:hypothetical protein